MGSIYFFVKASFVSLVLLGSIAFGDDVVRYGIFVGHNDGGAGRVQLRYAVKDAELTSAVFSELGGLALENQIFLKNPSTEELEKAFLTLGKKIRSDRQTVSASTRSEVLFYYSGHSNEEGLLFGNRLFRYAKIKQSLDQVGADLRVLVLDSCSSGAVVAAKGGFLRRPFLKGSPSSLRGQVILTSSSATELAQESDRINGSYFTHHLVSGLRGAADRSGDHKVTLDEAYQYAYNRTLAQTQKTLNGAQHPYYSMQLTGNGEWILTQLKADQSLIQFDPQLAGKFLVIDRNQRVVSEIVKEPNARIDVALSPGEYEVLWAPQQGVFRQKITLLKQARVVLAEQAFKAVEQEQTYLRGTGLEQAEEVDPARPRHQEAAENQTPEEGPYRVGAEFSVIPHISTNPFNPHYTDTPFRLSLFYGLSRNVGGVTMTLVGYDRVRGNLTGFQFAPVARVEGDVTGVQIGAVNSAGAVKGVQIGAVNMADQVEGVQIGIVNSRKNKGVSIGLVTLQPGSKLKFELGSMWISQFKTQNLRLLAKFGPDYLYSYGGFSVGPSARFRSRLHVGLGSQWNVLPWLHVGGEAGFDLNSATGRMFSGNDYSYSRFLGDEEPVDGRLHLSELNRFGSVHWKAVVGVPVTSAVSVLASVGYTKSLIDSRWVEPAWFNASWIPTGWTEYGLSLQWTVGTLID